MSRPPGERKTAMLVHFYEIPGCTCANADGRPVLIAPNGTAPTLLTKYEFVLLEDGRWCHFLTTPEYEHVMTGYPNRDVIFGDPAAVRMPVQETAPADPSEGNRMADIGLILLAVSVLLPMAAGGLMTGMTVDQETADSTVTQMLSQLVTIASAIGTLAGTASFVVMIITRIRYPKNKRGKVLMWIFIVLAILTALAMIALIVACVSCLDSMRNCNL